MHQQLDAGVDFKEAMKSIQETMSGLSDNSAFETFDRMSEKIDQIEAEAEAGAELSEEFTGDVLKHKFDKLEAECAEQRAALERVPDLCTSCTVC